MLNIQSRAVLPSTRRHARGRFSASALLLSTGLALAAPGDLDLGFGDGGLVSLRLSEFGGTAATAVTQQPDGKLIVAGLGDVSPDNDDDWIIVRLDENGTLDSSFGNGGVLTADYANFYDAAFAVTRQSDGKLVLAGSVGVSAGESDIALARFTADGTLDPTFGTNGWATVDLGGSDELALGVVQQPSGKFVVAGYTRSGATDRGVIARFNPEGTVDTTFGTGGATLLDFGAGSQSAAYALAQQPDGKLVVVGSASGDGVFDVGVARVTAEGILDTSFNGDGMMIIDVNGGSEQAFAVAVQQDSAIVVAGYTAAVGGEHANGLVIRLNGDGSPDPTFGSNGSLVADLGAYAIFYALVAQADGRLIATGLRQSGESFLDMILVRFQSSGALDEDFGAGGVATADFGKEDTPATTSGYAVMQQTDGKHVAVGYNFNGGLFAIARFSDSSASPGRIGLTSTLSSASEETDATVSYTVRRTGGKSGAVSVDYATVAGTAVAGSDFLADSGRFDWNDGDTSDRSITVDLIDDELAETPEDFSLVLATPTGGARLAASEATINIQSTDGPGELRLIWPITLDDTHHVQEGIGAIRLFVARLYGSEGEISVEFGMNRGSATAGSDFVSDPGRLTWADGDTASKSLEVKILDDELDEETERFDVQILNPTGGATIGSDDRQNVFIVDNDPPGSGGGGGSGGDDGGGGGNGGGGSGGGGSTEIISLLLLGVAKLLLSARNSARLGARG